MANISELIIYEPLDSFTKEERKSWSEDESFYVTYLKRGRRVYVAPENISLRTVLTIISMVNQIIADKRLFLEEKAGWEAKKKEMERKLSAIEDKYPNLKFYTFFGHWEVPLEWFALFKDKEREYGHDEDFGGYINYETSLRKGKERLNRAINIVGEANLGNYFLNKLMMLRDFLRGYHYNSHLVLDYAEVNFMFPNEELKKDRSARDLWNGLYALEKGQTAESIRYFEILEKRWGERRKTKNKLAQIFKDAGIEVMDFSDKEDEEL